MRNKRVIAIVAVLAFGLSAVAIASPRPDQLSFPPLALSLPDVSHYQTANGMKLYIKADDELPLVDLTIMIPGGSIYDPPEKTGLAQLFSRALETGGTVALTPEQLERELDLMAAELVVTSSTYAYQIDLSIHQRDLDRSMEILADVLRRPRFDPQRVELARQHLLDAVHRQNDRPASIAGRYLAQAVNPGHPLGLEADLETLGSLTQDDLQGVHQRFFHPQFLWWGVSGAVDEHEFLALLSHHFGDWHSDKAHAEEFPSLPEPNAATTYLIDRKLSQTTLMLGHRGISKDNPDFHAVRLVNYILGGGGFNSRLMREIRSSRGLAYSIYSQFVPGRHLPELFVVVGETGNDNAFEVVRLVRQLIDEMIATPVSADELDSAKSSLINSFVFAFENTHSVVTQNMRLGFYSYPEDFLETYLQQIEALTSDDIHQVAGRYLQPQHLQVVLVGDSDILLEYWEGDDADMVMIKLD